MPRGMGTWNWIWTSHLWHTFSFQCVSLATWQYPPSVEVNSGNTPQQGTDTPAPWTRAHNDVSKPDGLKTGKCRGWDILKTFCLNFFLKLFVHNPCQSSPISTILVSCWFIVTIWCFSALENYYLEVCFDLRMIVMLSMINESKAKSDLLC